MKKIIVLLSIFVFSISCSKKEKEGTTDKKEVKKDDKKDIKKDDKKDVKKDVKKDEKVVKSAKLGGYMDWKIGMTKDEVKKIAKYAPYTVVKKTNGLETKTGVFNGKKRTISFIFRDEKLIKIQIWAYEGKDDAKAVQAYSEVFEFLKKKYGDLESVHIKDILKTDKKGFIKSVTELIGKTASGKLFKTQMKPKKSLKDIFVFSSYFKHPKFGNYVFLYYTKPKK
jgi:hypothetical protein